MLSFLSAVYTSASRKFDLHVRDCLRFLNAHLTITFHTLLVHLFRILSGLVGLLLDDIQLSCDASSHGFLAHVERMQQHKRQRSHQLVVTYSTHKAINIVYSSSRNILSNRWLICAADAPIRCYFLFRYILLRFGLKFPETQYLGEFSVLSTGKK